MTHTQEQTLDKIDFDKKSYVYFKNMTRPPIYGKFVRLGDAEEMLAKGYVRFVSESMIDRFNEVTPEARKIMLTRLQTLDEIREIKTY